MRALEPLTAVGIGIAIFNEIFTLQLTVRLRILLYAKPVNTETKNISRARDLQGWSKGGGLFCSVLHGLNIPVRLSGVRVNIPRKGREL